MKRIISAILCAAFLMASTALSSCSTEKAVIKPVMKEIAVPAEETTTLMIYMIGSDLESKTGAATNDLEEILQSGIDLSVNEVIVCAGGSYTWHNDIAGQDNNTVFSLTADGYKKEKTDTAASMGEAKALSDFLDYCVSEHPSDHYALILWDHGNGPLIGYGKDTLFGNDSLTLSEMTEAMESSPFSRDYRLDWVGFDACLMASAELALVWSPYADYLVASQEVEPAFGWNYSFLKDCGKIKTEELLIKITEDYLEACLKYFEKKNYTGRDSTLSFVDLSLADNLKQALDELFIKAGENISERYDELSAKRVNTRAVGRASTGSEYDLVDLKDLCDQLSQDYPEEAGKLSGIIDEMVISNSTNAEGLCGMSLYYPFYNKSYYESSWRETYESMGLFSGYNAYLSKYQDKWLGTDIQDENESSETPDEISAGRYSLKLTPEKAEHFASAKYYILKKDGKETFSSVYSSPDVSLSGDTLKAEFDGNFNQVTKPIFK